jgi:hypothetical protein
MTTPSFQSGAAGLLSRPDSVEVNRDHSQIEFGNLLMSSDVHLREEVLSVDTPLLRGLVLLQNAI